jgi:RNA polymerase sigma-70 factor (ECF subfamily)
MAEPTLARLAERARLGGSEATRALLRAIAPTILSTSRKILRDKTEAEDVAQEAMISFARDVHALRNPEAVKAFAARLTTRLAIRARHRRAKERDARADMAQELATDRSKLADDPAASRETTELLLEVLDQLPDEQSETLLLRYFMGHTLEEVAAATEVPANTVRSRIRLARQALGRHLTQDPRFATLKEAIK